MVLIELLAKNQKPETLRPCGQKFENPRLKETQESEISRLIQNASEISRSEQKIFEILNFQGTIRHPPSFWI